MYNLPKRRLSWSQINCWVTNKDAYRSRYYMNEPMHETPELIFGKNIAKLLEQGSLNFKVPQYSHQEYKLETEVDGIPMIGYLDSFEPKRCAFLDHKTSHTRADGSAPWTQTLVQKHDQLALYSFLIKKIHGKVQPTCKLVWLETRWKKHKMDFNGIELEGNSNELELTGRIEIFNRKIESWEHDRMRELIVKTAKDISQDYTEFVKILTP